MWLPMGLRLILKTSLSLIVCCPCSDTAVSVAALCRRGESLPVSRLVPHDSWSSYIPLREIMEPSGAAFRSTWQKLGHPVTRCVYVAFVANHCCQQDGHRLKQAAANGVFNKAQWDYFYFQGDVNVITFEKLQMFSIFIGAADRCI